MMRMILITMSMLVFTLNTGCSMFTKDKSAKKDSAWESMQFWKKGYQQPTKMAVLWSHDLLTVAGQAPTRGFGGRIYFYNNKSQTIPVEGELVVHGFDETLKKATGAAENQPDKRFRFTAEQFTEHFSESDLGASYSVWIPWDAGDGIQKEITLIPTFVSSKGEMVQGAPAKVVLPGRTQPSQSPGASPNSGSTSGQAPNQQLSPTPIQTVSYEQSSIPTVQGPLPNLTMPVRDTAKLIQTGGRSSGLRTTTIAVPTTIHRAGQAGNTTLKNSLNTTQAGPVSGGQDGPNAQVKTMMEQARAQAIADAFRPIEPMPQRPVQSFSAWNQNHGNAFGNNSSMTFVPPNFPSNSQMPNSQMSSAPNGQLPVGQMPSSQMTSGQFAPQPVPGAVQPQAAPMQAPSQALMPSAPRGAGAEDYPGGLPPGFQLSPRANGWQ